MGSLYLAGLSIRSFLLSSNQISNAGLRVAGRCCLLGLGIFFQIAASRGQTSGHQIPTLLPVAEFSAPLSGGATHEDFLGGDNLTDVVWSKDGSRLAAHSSLGTRVLIWTKGGTLLRDLSQLRPGPSGRTIAFLDGGNKIATSPVGDLPQNVALSVIDIASGRQVFSLPGPFPNGNRVENFGHDFVVSVDETKLAVVYGAIGTRVDVWSLVDHSAAPTSFKDDSGAMHFHSLALSLNSKMVAIGTFEGRVLIYDVASGQLVSNFVAFGRPYDPTPLIVQTLKFSDDGSEIAAAPLNVSVIPSSNNPDGETTRPIRVFHVGNGALVASTAQSWPAVWTLGWLSKGKLLAYLPGVGRIHLWDISPSSQNSDEVLPLPWRVQDFALSPAGDEFAVSHGRTIDVSTLQTVR